MFLVVFVIGLQIWFMCYFNGRDDPLRLFSTLR